MRSGAPGVQSSVFFCLPIRLQVCVLAGGGTQLCLSCLPATQESTGSLLVIATISGREGGEPQLCPSHPSSSEMGCLSCGKAPEARPRMVPFFAALLACFYCNVPQADYVARCLDREAALFPRH